ncbi:MAG: 3-isopropylmalate dehydrogenase [Actinomycetia bacterium]|nr:3-isopropylmalate dehydrogenase [Actinomycetes bacterium]
MDFHIVTVSGDGIGPDVVEQGKRILDKVGEKFGHSFQFEEQLAGGVAIDATGEPLPEQTVEACLKSDSVLLGAVGGPKWDNLPNVRPEQALLGLRSRLGLFANLRPAELFAQLAAASPLKPEIIGHELDLLIVRELTGGIYFGEHGRSADGHAAWDTEAYSTPEIERVLRVGFDAAAKRRGKLTVVDKANILETSRLWREVARAMAAEHPDIQCEYLYVDNCAMQLIRDPKQFDVIVTSNMFGDILSDEASMLAGSIGMLASASLGDRASSKGILGMYEPIHGSAPDIADQDLANPIATILSCAMMLRYSFDLQAEADAVRSAVERVLDKGYRTGDIYSEGTQKVGTKEMGALIAAEI